MGFGYRVLGLTSQANPFKTETQNPKPYPLLIHLTRDSNEGNEYRPFHIHKTAAPFHGEQRIGYEGVAPFDMHGVRRTAAPSYRRQRNGQDGGFSFDTHGACPTAAPFHGAFPPTAGQ